MKTLMQSSNRYFATTQLEAESLVNAAKEQHGSNIKSTQIIKKTKREVDYFIVNITVEYYKVSDLLVFD